MKRIFYFILCGVLSLFFSCKFQNVTIDRRIEKIFQENKVEGSFIWMDNAKGEFVLSDLSEDTTRKAVRSSIALPLALIALEVGFVPNERDPMRVKDSFTLSYFIENANQRTIDQMYASLDIHKVKEWIDKLHYGDLDETRIENTLLSSDEQLGFIKRLYFNQLPFSNRSMSIVKKMLPTHRIGSSSVSAFQSGEGDSLLPSWNMGWLEYGKDVYFFACSIESKTTKIDRALSQKILKAILHTLYEERK